MIILQHKPLSINISFICKNMNKSNFVTHKFICCAYCNNNDASVGVHLQCNHQLHYECLNRIILKTYGEYIDSLNVKKSVLINGIEDKKENEMVLLVGDNKVINCPTCDIPYSVFSPIYRNFGIPKIIQKTIVFFDDNNITHNFHICTNVDIVHLLPIKEQTRIFKKFNFDKEDNCITEKIISKYPYLQNLCETECEIFHAIVENGKNVKFVDALKCPVCSECNKSVSSDNTIDTTDMIVTGHCTIANMYKLLFKVNLNY